MRSLVLVLTLLALPSQLHAEPATTTRPNIVFIFSDDHAYQAISDYGGRLTNVAPTPHLAFGTDS